METVKTVFSLIMLPSARPSEHNLSVLERALGGDQHGKLETCVVNPRTRRYASRQMPQHLHVRSESDVEDDNGGTLI